MKTTKTTVDGPEAPTRRRFSSLQHRDFRVLWLGMVFSGSTFVFQWYAQSWFIVQTTDSPIALGILGGGRGIVMVLLSVYGGILADRLDRRMLLIVSQTLSMLVYAVLSALVILDLAELWLVFVLVMISAAALSVDQPVRQALIPELVPRREIPNATALVMAAQMGAFAYLPPLAGVAIDHLGSGWTFALSLTGHVGIIAAAIMLHYRSTPTKRGAVRRSVWSDAGQGFRYAVNERKVFWSFGITWAISGLGWPLIVTLSPLWMKNELGLGATGFTLISSAWGSASLVSSIYLAQRDSIPMLGRIFLASAFAFCGSLMLFAFSRSIPLVTLAWALNGLAFSANMIAMTAMIQVMVPSEVLGRIMGLMTVSRSMSQLSGLPLSLIAHALGMTVMVPGMAITCLAVCGVMVLTTPTLRRMAKEG